MNAKAIYAALGNSPYKTYAGTLSIAENDALQNLHTGEKISFHVYDKGYIHAGKTTGPQRTSNTVTVTYPCDQFE